MTDTGATTELRRRARPHPPAIGAATPSRGSDGSVFDETTLAAFAEAGLRADSIAELRGCGIHLTVAVRHPKTRDRISAATVAAGSPLLADELAAFPEARAYLLMGDVAIAAINQIARRRTGRRAIPAGSTYRIRDGEYHLDGVRLFPSYLQAGPAWYIEASQRRMVAEDIAAALAVAGIAPSADRPLTRATAARPRTPPRSR